LEHGSSTPGDSAADPFEALLERAARLTPLPCTAAPRLHPGLELWHGRFQVRRRIGAGGMGVVHEAFDRERGHSVALKTLSRLDPPGIYRLKQEFRALTEVTHPNLVQLHELFADRDLWLFTMELVAGERFDDWTRRDTALDHARLRAALRQLAAGVRAIHDAGKLHRDLKPSNVLVTHDGRVVILDFGLVADPEPGGAGQTLDNERRSGTPAYMSPEQARGAAATAASDWYAVGVMLFEAITGQLPFNGHGQAIMERKQADAVPRARSIAPSAPADLDDLCALLLSRDANLRPSAQTISARLEAHASAAPEVLSLVRPLSARPAHLLGREAETAALHDAYATAAAGEALVVRVSGESGMGKSALVGAFLDELRAANRAVVISGRCYERESVPYKAVDRVVDELTRYLRKLREVETATLMPRDIGALARVFPVLHRIELIAQAPTRPAANDQELRRRAFDAFAELLACIRDRHTLVLHIDDLQWTDHDSMLLLEHLLNRPDPAPVLLIVAYRPMRASEPLLGRIEHAARSNPRVTLREIALGPLSTSGTLDLARTLLGTSSSRERLVQVVAAEAEGSPFFVGELARYALQTGADTDADRVSLEHAICSRVAHLDHDACEVIELLAVSGRPTPGRVLAQAAGSTAMTHRALDRLRGAQLVREAGANAYECYHDRIRVALLEQMPAATVRARHVRLIAALSDQADADPEVLFEHSRAAGDHANAGTYAVHAATKAATSLAFERSATFLEQAIELLAEPEIERLGLRERRAEALSLAGRWTEAARAFEDAGLHSGEQARGTHLLRQSALHFLGSGRGIEGLPRLRRVCAAVGIAWPKTRVGALTASLARLLWLWLRGAPRQRPRAASDPGPRMRDDQDAIVLEILLEAAGVVPPYDFARGLYFMTVFAARALRRSDPPQKALALAMLSAMFAALRPMRHFGYRLVDEACALARSHDVAYLRSAALCFGASARMLEGRLQEGLTLAAEAEGLLRPSGRAHVYGIWTARALQSHALVELGFVGQAALLFEANARLSREVGDDMAMIGGDSSLRYLLIDDVENAQALISRKEQALAGTRAAGALHEVVHVERIMCALYQGRAAEFAFSASVLGSASPSFFDASALIACCALQAPNARDRDKLRIVHKVMRGLRSQVRSDHRAAGMHAQLRGAILFVRGDTQGALAQLALADQRYMLAGLLLHAAIMRWHAARLRGGVDNEVAQQAEQFMRAQRIVRPSAWARMLAPGFGS
jgi:hypothetical protein